MIQKENTGDAPWATTKPALIPPWATSEAFDFDYYKVTFAEHSPAPWKIANRENAFPNTWAIMDKDGHKVAQVESFPSSTTGKADAHTLRAGPELAAATARLLQLWAAYHPEHLAKFPKQVVDVIIFAKDALRAAGVSIEPNYAGRNVSRDL